MHDRILVPTDDSTGTAHVALQAIDLAEKYDATLHAINVIDANLLRALSDISETKTELRRRGRDAVRRIERMARAHGLDVETTIREGDPADEILVYADEIDASIIVAGTHGRSGVKRRLIGSVAENLVRHADCPVMTVRLPDTDVTVEDEDHARELAEEALDDHGDDWTITAVNNQETVWTVEADTPDGPVVVYLDPITQLTSVAKRN